MVTREWVDYLNVIDHKVMEGGREERELYVFYLGSKLCNCVCFSGGMRKNGGMGDGFGCYMTVAPSLDFVLDSTEMVVSD